MENSLSLYIILLYTLASILVYVVFHESMHIVWALIFGYKIKLGIRSDGVLPSLAIEIRPEVKNRIDRIIILYSPYVMSPIIFFLSNFLNDVMSKVLKAIILIGMANIVLEEQANIHRLVVSLICAFFLALWSYTCLSSI